MCVLMPVFPAVSTDDVRFEVPLEGGAVVAERTLVRSLPRVGAQVAFQFGPLSLVLAHEPAPAHRTHEHTRPL